ncbi:MAG: 6-bladed beta-propeller [Bacteroidota bacterium]|nr:6-bladed beta-propeller [Bacteroidota bacterium]
MQSSFLKRSFYVLLGALFIFIVIVLIATVVRRLPDSNVAVLHPTPQNIPDATVLVTGKSDSAYFDISYWSSRQPSSRVGVAEGPQHAMLGSVRSVSVDANQNVFILDGEYTVVRIYSTEGDYIGSFGRAGNGPGEFGDPKSIDLLESDSLAVIIGREERVIIYRRLDSLEYVFGHSFIQHDDVYSVDGCAMNGHIYVLGYSPEKDGVIHKYDLAGRFITAFGDKYVDPDPWVAASLSRRGLLACSDTHDTVAWIRQNVPVVNVCTGNGDLLERYKLQNFVPAEVTQRLTEDGRPSLSYSPPKKGESWFSNLFTDDDGAFIVSHITVVDTTSMHGDFPPEKYHAYRLNPHLGTETYLGSIPGIVAISGDKIVLRTETPFPQVLIYEEVIP